MASAGFFYIFGVGLEQVPFQLPRRWVAGEVSRTSIPVASTFLLTPASSNFSAPQGLRRSSFPLFVLCFVFLYHRYTESIPVDYLFMIALFHSYRGILSASIGHLVVEFNASPKCTIGESLLLLSSQNNIYFASRTIEDMLTDTLHSIMSYS